MRDFIRDHTRPFKNLAGIGTGGNINKLYKLADEKDQAPLSFLRLKTLYNYLNSFSLKDRINVLGLNQDRGRRDYPRLRNLYDSNEMGQH